MGIILLCDRGVYNDLGPIPAAFQWNLLLSILAAAVLILPVLVFVLRKEVATVEPGNVLRDGGSL